MRNLSEKELEVLRNLKNVKEEIMTISLKKLLNLKKN